MNYDNTDTRYNSQIEVETTANMNYKLKFSWITDETCNERWVLSDL